MADNTTYSDEEFLNLIRGAGEQSAPLSSTEDTSSLSDEEFLKVINAESAPAEPQTPFMQRFTQAYSPEEEATQRELPPGYFDDNITISSFPEINKYYQDIIGKSNVQLPVPTTQMYADLTPKGLAAIPVRDEEERQNLERQAQERRAVYEASPESRKSWWGEIAYKGAVVPPYAQDIATGAMDVGPLVDLYGVGKAAYIINEGFTRTGPKQIAELGAAGIDAATAYLLNYNPKFTEAVADNFVEINTGTDISDALLNEGAGLFTGIGGEVALTKGLTKIAPSVAEISRKLISSPVSKVSGDISSLAYKISQNPLYKKIAPFAGAASDMLIDFVSPVAKDVAWVGSKVLPSKEAAAGLGTAGIRTLRTEAGMTAATKSDADTLVYGPNSLYTKAFGGAPIGFGVSADDPEYEKVIDKRANILADSLSFGTGVQVLGRGSVFVARLMGKTVGVPLKFAIGFDPAVAQQDAIIDDIIETLVVGTDLAQTPAQRDALVLELADLVQMGKEIEFRVPLSQDAVLEVSSVLDTAAALIRGIEAKQAAGNTDDATQFGYDLIKRRAEGIRKGAMSDATKVQTSQKIGEFPKETLRTIEQAQDFYGGDREMRELLGDEQFVDMFKEGYLFQNRPLTVDAMTAEFQQQGLNAVEAEEAVMELIGREYDTVNDTIDASIRTDSSFLGRLQALSDASDIDILAPKTEAQTKIVDRAVDAFVQMSETSNRLFSEVKGGYVDAEALADALIDRISPEQFTQIKSVTDPYYSAFMGALVGDTPADVKANFVKWADANELDFAKLFTQVRPSLSFNINELTKAAQLTGNKVAGDTAIVLRKLRDYIDTEAINDLRKNTNDADVLDAADTAMDYYKNEFAPYWRTDDIKDPLSEIAHIYKRTVGRAGIRRETLLDKGREQVQRMFSPQNQAVGGKAVQLLRRPEAGGDPDVVLDLFVGDLFTRLEPKLLEKGKLADIDASALRKEIQSFAGLLKAEFPVQAAKLENLMDFLTTSKAKKEALLLRKEKAQKAFELAKDKVLKEELSSFFAKDLNLPVDDGYTAMASIFADKQRAEVTLKALKARAAKSNPLVLDGMKASYLNYLKGKEYINTLGVGNVPFQREKNLSDVRKDLLLGEIIWGKGSEFMVVLTEMLGEANVLQRSVKAKPVPTDSPTAFLLTQQQRLRSAVTQLFGPLSRTGSRVGNIGTRVLSSRLDPAAYAALNDSILSNPDLFINLLRKSVTKTGELNRRRAYQFLVHAGVYNEGEEKQFDKDFAQDDQTSLMETLEAGARATVDFMGGLVPDFLGGK